MAGETRPSRSNRNEPELPGARVAAPPATLRGAGRREWIRLAPQLVEAGLLRDADFGCFEDYCRALSDLRAYETKARKVGLERAIATGFQGQTVKLRAQVAQLRNHLGLTPTSRHSVKQIGGGAGRGASRIGQFLNRKSRIEEDMAKKGRGPFA